MRELGRVGEAIECCEQAVRYDPRHGDAWYMKGAILITYFQRYRDAITCMEEAGRLGASGTAEAIAWCKRMLSQ